MELTFDRRHEVALKCPGGTKAISLGFQLVETKSETISSTLTNALKMLERGLVWATSTKYWTAKSKASLTHY